MSYVTLEGYIVRAETRLAVGLCKEVIPLGKPDVMTWVPRSQCDGGDVLERGDKDIVVTEWFADKEGLDY